MSPASFRLESLAALLVTRLEASRRAWLDNPELAQTEIRRITAEVADRALAMLEIDRNGLDEMDKRILETIIVKFAGGPVGISSMAVAVGEEPDTLEEVYEPYLIMEGYLKRTSQGRVATELSYRKLGLQPTEGRQPRLL